MTDEPKTQLGRLLRQLRLAADLSQQDIENRTGMDQGHYSKIERGALARPNGELLRAIAEVLGVAPERLFIAAYEGRDVGLETEPVEVKFYGLVPADAVRWVAAEEGAEMRRVLPEWIGTRSPDDFFVVEASGDCLLASDGIASGNYVLLQRHANDDPLPRDNTVILVRIGDEYSLKRWFATKRGFELRDGHDVVKHRLAHSDAFVILGRYVTHWRPVNDT